MERDTVINEKHDNYRVKYNNITVAVMDIMSYITIIVRIV